MQKRHHIIYIAAFACVFIAMVVVFNFFERSTYSELERRELAQFPNFSADSLAHGHWTDAVSTWYSDTEPFREHFMNMSMSAKGMLALNSIGTSDDNISFHANEDVEDAEVVKEVDPDELAADGKLAEEYTNKLTAKEENAKMGHKGILVIGSAPTARALMCFGGSRKGAIKYAELANEYHRQLKDLGVQVYVMAIPGSIEYYCPDKAKSSTKPQRETILGLHEHLDPEIKPVDVYTTLGRHASEPIFLRTDHHWAPLGAYYAAKQFAIVANVPFMDISKYTKHTVPDFVGTMYGYSKDIAIKNSPEDFDWYEPTGVTYETTYINYQVDDNYQVVSESKPVKGKYFYTLKGGMAYSTFMGGDMKLTHIKTSTKNGRKLLIIKDSFGNALPGYLFGSFEEIHVVDCRYFTKNMKSYCREHGVTDLLFANNVFKCCEGSLKTKVLRYLHQ